MFRFYNSIANASRSIAWGIFVFGLMLIGFGVLILAFPEVFAMLAAVVFFIAGVGCAGTALKIYMVQRHISKMTRDDGDEYRENVRIHIEEGEEF
jgi:cobalamin biosynthesis protein CobD/CbiB